MATGASYTTDEESRWVVTGICLTKVVTPTLRKAVDAELKSWYQDLCKPPVEIDKQVSGKQIKTLAPSTLSLQYKNINGNDVHKSPKSPRAYDYAVKDALSLAKLFVQPFMAKFTGFDDTMDLSALLTLMCEADPFITSGASVYAKNVRLKVRNEWAHCDFSNWTNVMFNDAIQDMEFLMKNINLSADLEKQACDDLLEWKNKVSDVFVDGRYLKLLDELRRSGETWQFEEDKKMDKVVEELDNLKSRICKIDEVERCAADNSEKLQHNSKELKRQAEKIERNTDEIESLHKKIWTEHSDYAEKQSWYGLRSLPRDMVRRSSEVKEILKLLTEGNSKVGVVGSRSGDVVGIRGMGGLGKTILALAVAWEVSVSRQVIWLDVGETPDCLALINILVKVLGGAISFSVIREAQDWIKKNTSDKECLVVLDDVWNVNDAAVFDTLSEKCQLLITTRDVNVVRGSRGFVYELDIMEQDKSRELFFQSVGIKQDELPTFSPKMQEIIKELLKQCKGLPLALSLVGSNLNGNRSEQVWQDILDGFTTDLEELHSMVATDDYPYDNIVTAINISFERLEQSEQEKFLDFGIFPEDTNIPSDVLELFWSAEGAGRTSCEPRKTRRILDALERKSMIQKGLQLQEKTSYRVHDLLLDFARRKLKVTGSLTSVQRLFVETLRGQCVNGEWNENSTTAQKDYYFKFLPYHISSSEQHGELLQLFFDLNWLQQKVKHIDLPSVVSDFRFLGTLSQETQLLKSSLMFSSHVIEKNADSICPQLLGRLLSYEEFPGIKTLLEQLRATCTETCRLIPEFSCLDLGGPEIFRKTFHSEVCSLATCNTSSATLVICGLKNGSITIFDLDTGREVQQLQGHSEEVSCLAVSQSGTILASAGSWDQSTILWRMDNYEQLFVFQGESAVKALDFSADDQRVFIGTDDGLKAYCVSTGENLSTSIPERVRSLCTTKDGQFIATVGYLDKTIKLWKADTLNFEASLVGHTDWVRCVVATDSGKNNPMLVSASYDGTIKIWDLKTYQEIRTLKGHESDVTRVAVSGDKKNIISGDSGGSARLWCFHTGKSLSCYKGHTKFISGVAIIPNAKKVLTASWDGSIRVWNLGTAAYMQQNSFSDHSNDVTDIKMSRDESRWVSASTDGTFKVWNLHTQCFSVTGDLEWAKDVAVSADDRYVVSLSKDGNILLPTKSSIKVWNLSDGSVINEIDSDDTPEIVRFGSDGLQAIIGCKDNHVFIWDWQKPDASLKEVILPASYTVELACDRNMIYTCSRDMHTCEINLDSLQVSTVRQGSSPPVISPDGKIVFGSLQNNVFFHGKLSTNSWVDHNAGHPDDSIVTAIGITSNGKFALSGSSSGTLSLVDIECSKIVQTFAKTESGVAIRFVCLLSDDVRFVFVDGANRIDLRTFNDIEASINLGQPEVKVTCITALGSNYALLGCDDGELLWFHLNNNSQLKFPAHKDAISQVKGEQGGHDRSRPFASGSIGGSVKLWNVEENLPTLIWSHDNICSDSITALELVPRSDDIIIASGDEIDRVNEDGVVHSYGYLFLGRIQTIRVVHNSLFCAHKEAFTTEAKEGITKWNLNGTENESISDFYTEKVLRINNSGNLVAILGRGSLVIENFRTGKVLHRFPIQNSERITALALAPTGEFLLSCSYRDKTLKLWNLPNGECVEEFHFDRDVSAIACGSNGMLCVGLEGGRVCFLRLNKLSSH